MEWPALSLLVVTYNRRALLQETLRRLHEHVYYAGPLHFVVADDGSDDGTQDMLRTLYPHAQIVETARGGLGANTNAGLRAALSHADQVLQCQDDMHLLTTLDLHPHVERLRDDPTCGFIRLWGVAGHKYEGRLEGNMWRVFWHSDELYIPSDRPHLKHRRFVEHYGPYPEGRTTAETEESYCHQCKGRAGLEGKQIDVFVPSSVDLEKSWEHAGWHQRFRDIGL